MKKILITLILINFCLLKFLAQGDTPCSATPMTINSGGVCGVYINGTTIGNTYSNNASNGGTPTCGNPGSADVWYSFVAPISGNINVYTNVGSITDGAMQLYSSSNNLCTGLLTAYNCDDDSGPGLMPQLNLCGLTPGNTYFIRFWKYGSGTGTFSICFWDSYIGVPSSTNCVGGTQVCNNSGFTGNNSGLGVQELNVCNNGCLVNGEHNSSWYWLNIGTTGTLNMTITPTNGTDDYDFAIWGPTNSCPPTTSPVRCNYAAYPRAFGCGTNTNPTGMGPSGTSTSVSACQNQPYTTPLNVVAGQIYVLLIDGFTVSSQPFNLTWGGTATLSCTPISLPIELIEFNGHSKGMTNYIYWATSTETNNDYFTLEKSPNAIDWNYLDRIKGGGNMNTPSLYEYTDNKPFNGVTYYRLKQTDFNGSFEFFNIIAVKNERKPNYIVSLGDNVIYLTDQYEYQLYNTIGQLVDSGKGNIIRTSRFGSGIYILKVGSFTEKVIIR